jgi:hypothetical protein
MMIMMRTFSTFAATLLLALGFASCKDDNKDADSKKGTGTTVEVTVTHPQYSNGVFSVILGSPVTIGADNLRVEINPRQYYKLELSPESNEYFTFTSDGLLTGIKEGDDVGEITIRVLAEDGKTLASKIITVNVVGMMVSIVGHENYVNDTFRVVANEEFMVSRSHVQVTPGKPEYTVKFVPKNTRYFTFSDVGVLQGVLDGVGVIEALVLSSHAATADTLKVQPFYVKVSPAPDWVTKVTGDVAGKKTIYFQRFETGKPVDVSRYFTVSGGVNRKLRYTSSNTGVATVDENTGMVTVKATSSYAFIKATATDGSQRADSIRVTTARTFPGHSCDWNLCNILTEMNTKEDPRYVSCKVWDGDVSTAWVYRLEKTFTRDRYPGVTFLRGVYGKEWVAGDCCSETVPDWVLGGPPIPKKETTWGVWAANLDGTSTFKKFVVTRGFYTDEQGRKIFQSGTMYLEFWDNNTGKCVKLGKHTFTSDPNDNEWVVDLTQTFEVWDAANNASLGVKPFPNGVEGTELQMMFSIEGASPARDGSYYWAIADVLLFES